MVFICYPQGASMPSDSPMVWMNYIFIGGYDNNYRTGEGQQYHGSQQTISLHVLEQNADQKDREAEGLVCFRKVLNK